MSRALPLTTTESVSTKKSFFTRSTITFINEVSPEEQMIFISRNNELFTQLSKQFKSSVRLGSILKSIEFIKQNQHNLKGQWLTVIFDNYCTIGDLELLHRSINSAGLSEKTIIILHVDQANSKGEMNLRALAPYLNDIVNVLQNESFLSKRLNFLRKIATKKHNLKPLFFADFLSFEKSASIPSTTKYIGKRIVDILISGTLILLLSPVFLIIALLIRMEGKGPIFYTSKRAGKGYKIFDFYKFRTMVPDADKKVAELLAKNQYSTDGSNGPVFFKLKDDPRITRLGTYLRNTSLDELPQLFNVFKGDMSLVGNRPLPLYEAETLTTDSFAERFMAPAGITGLWQVKKRGHAGEMSIEERINLDIEYAKKHSFMYDLWIMVSTPKALLQKENV